MYSEHHLVCVSGRVDKVAHLDKTGVKVFSTNSEGLD